jgi:GT2 family glycosyltransferase
MSDTPEEGLVDSVHAIVLTYNAPEDLARCLASIRRQTVSPSRVTVIDNGSSPPVTDADVEVVRVGENTGPAGGWVFGLRHFLSSGQARAWLLDDDCEAETDCLEVLLGSDAGISVPFHRSPFGTSGYFPSWTGVLLTRSAVEHLGLPRAEFFWWCEDTEYLQHRPRRIGVTSKNVEGANVVNHATRRGGGQPPWKTYYESRNGTYYRFFVQAGGPVLVRAWKWIRGLLAVAKRGMRTDNYGLQIRAFTLGVRDGLTKRLGKTMDPGDPTWRASS